MILLFVLFIRDVNMITMYVIVNKIEQIVSLDWKPLIFKDLQSAIEALDMMHKLINELPGVVPAEDLELRIVHMTESGTMH